MTAPRDPYNNPYGNQGQPPYGQPQQPQQQWTPQQPPPYGQPQYGQPQPAYGAPQYGAPGGYGQPPKKSSGGKIALIIIGSFVGLCLVASIIGIFVVKRTADHITSPLTGDSDSGGTVTFKVTGTGSVNLTWVDSKFKTSREPGTLPWSKTIDSNDSAGVNIVAQRESGDGTIACQIIRNGKVIAQNSESGTYAIVNCIIGYK